MRYAVTYGLDRENSVIFAIVIGHLDGAFWQFRKEKIERDSKAEGIDVKPKS